MSPVAISAISMSHVEILIKAYVVSVKLFLMSISFCVSILGKKYAPCRMGKWSPLCAYHIETNMV